MRKSLTFNGIKKPWLYLLEGRSKSPFAPVRNNLLRVKGMPGAYVTGTETDVLYISQPIGFVVRDDAHALQIKDELADWLVTDQPVELQFDDEQGRTYYAKVEGTIEDFTKFVNQRKGVITFICADPFSYGEEQQMTLSDTSTVINSGTMEANPIFELEVLQPITFAMIQNQANEYMMIGRPVSAEEPIVEPTTHILTDTGDSMIGWVAGSNPPDGLAVGEARSIDGKLRAFDYGLGSGWHGPVIKKSLPQVLQDFNIQIWIEFNEALADNTGRIQISLLDASNNTVGMLSFFDVYPQWFDKVGRVEVGDNIFVSDRKDWPDNFQGRLTLQRQGQEFIAKISQFENGVYKKTIQGTFTDFQNEHQAPITQIQLHFGAYGTHTRPFMAVDKIQVLKLNDTTDKVSYIANVGDVITFDHVDENILLNGESIIREKDFGAEYFKLKRGLNQLIALPNDSFNVNVRYRERYR